MKTTPYTENERHAFNQADEDIQFRLKRLMLRERTEAIDTWLALCPGQRIYECVALMYDRTLYPHKYEKHPLRMRVFHVFPQHQDWEFVVEKMNPCDTVCCVAGEHLRTFGSHLNPATWTFEAYVDKIINEGLSRFILSNWLFSPEWPSDAFAFLTRAHMLDQPDMQSTFKSWLFSRRNDYVNDVSEHGSSEFRQAVMEWASQYHNLLPA